MLAYKFVSWEVPALETLKDTIEYKLANKLEQGEPMTRAEKNRITALAFPEGRIKLQGWLFPLSGLKTFYVEQYYHISKQRGYDKTAIRAMTSRRIQHLQERD